MQSGFQAFKPDGTILFDTQYISYGLKKSGYLQLVGSWPRLLLRSINLNPTSPSSYSETSVRDVLFGFSVEGAVAPVVFISGSGVSCGSSKSGDITTFYYLLSSPSTKFFYFDLMTDTPAVAGLKCYSPSGVLTFNSIQTPLNIVASVSAPLPGNPRGGGYGTVYEGGTNGWDKPSGLRGYYYSYTSRVFIPLGSGEYAASINFSRSMGQGKRERDYPPDPAYGPALVYIMACMDGCFGGIGGVTFVACDAARTTMYESNSFVSQYYSIPTDVLPSALVIRSSDYPFPHN